jgi:hypothetical protein
VRAIKFIDRALFDEQSKQHSNHRPTIRVLGPILSIFRQIIYSIGNVKIDVCGFYYNSIYSLDN